MNTGYVSLHRKMFDNKLWLSEKFTKAQAWIDLFGNANHADNSFWVRGNEVKIKRGQIGWSELTMAQRWGWSKNRVRRFLKWLETEQQIEQQKTFITSIITIKNYDMYQETKQQTIQRKDSRRYTNNNVNNDNNENKIDMSDKSDAFTAFWLAYPKKEQKRKAQEIWLRKNLDPSLSAILEFIKGALATDRWKKGYIKDPTSFLNGECWNDDLSSYMDKSFIKPKSIVIRQ